MFKIKRLSCFLLAFLLCGSLAPSLVSADAAGVDDLTASDALVELIKDFEGFTKYELKRSSHIYIGYGTTCKAGDYPNGITREEAEVLLRKSLGKIGSTIKRFLINNDLTLTQNQYDALLSFSYNLGTGWLGYTNRLRTYLTDGVGNHSDMEIVNAFGVWCHIGKSVSAPLIRRKLIEASIFLYGRYDKDSPDSYRYVIFDPGDGEVGTDIVFYEYNKPYGVLQRAALEGYTFTGWITEDGENIVPDLTADRNLRVSACWAEGAEPVSYNPWPDIGEPDVFFSDVDKGSWYYDCVIELNRSNIINGYPDGTFRPGDPVTWGEALKLIMLAAGYAPVEASGSHWASGYLDTAISEGLIGENAVYDLEAPISRIAIAYVTAKALGIDESAIESPFTDISDGYVSSLYEIGIIQGSGENGAILFLPDRSMSRAEISAIISRMNSLSSASE